MTLCSDAIQVFGGIGYVEETGIAQFWRDARIAPIYEGTTAIHAQDLVFRKLGREEAYADFLDDARETSHRLRRIDPDSAARLDELLDSLDRATASIRKLSASDPALAAAVATPYLFVFGPVAAAVSLAGGVVHAANAAERVDREHSMLAAFTAVTASAIAGPSLLVDRPHDPFTVPVCTYGAFAMKLGTSLRFVFPTSEHTLTMYQQMVASLPPGAFVERPMGPIDTGDQVRHLLEVSRAAADAGLWALIVGDNHSVPAIYANCFQPIPTIARLSAVTVGLEIGAVFLAPFYHPLLLAEQIATIAALVDAPTLWVFAVGDRRAAFDAFAMPVSERARRTESLVPTVRSLLAGESVTATGPGWQIENAWISPMPRHVPQLLIAGAVDAAVDRAARIGDGWLTAQNATDDELARQLERYRDECANHKRSPWPVLRRDIFVAETDDAALDHVRPILAEGYRGVDLDRLIVGSPRTVVERLGTYRTLGFDHVLVRHITGDHAAMVDSFGLIGDQVIPEITEWSERTT